MSNSVRWTEEQLKAYQLKNDKPEMLGVDIDAIHRNQAPKESKIERRLIQQMTDEGITGWQRNYFFLPDRELELDIAFPTIRAAVEVQGMAHRIRGKFQRDIEKRALAMLAGWRVLEVDGSSIRDGRALQWLKALLSRPLPSLPNPGEDFPGS